MYSKGITVEYIISFILLILLSKKNVSIIEFHIMFYHYQRFSQKFHTELSYCYNEYSQSLLRGVTLPVKLPRSAVERLMLERLIFDVA